jgi:hypothetical protein
MVLSLGRCPSFYRMILIIANSNSERTYWMKIKDWSAQKYAAERQAQRITRQSIDSGYNSQSLCNSSSADSQYSQLTDDTSSIGENLAVSDQQVQHYGFLYSNKHSSTFQSRCEPGPDSPWSPVSSRADDFAIDTALSHNTSQRPLESRNFSEAALSGAGQSVYQYDHPAANPPLSCLGQCEGSNRLSACILDFCAPHALPSRCWAAHTKAELIGPNSGPISCQHCRATKLHHLASMAQIVQLWYFKEILLNYLPILGERDMHGNTCVHFAAGSGASLAQLEALASAGAPMELTNNSGQTFHHVLNGKLYDRHTLAPIIQWTLRTKGAMTKRDFRNRTVWHSIFQRGISPEIFSSILPLLRNSKDDMMILDNDDHTPLDCLRSYWKITKEAMAIDCLNGLQSSGILPLYFAVNQTAPIDDTVYVRTPARLPSSSELSADASRLTIGASTRRHNSNDTTRNCFDELVSTYINGGVLEWNTTVPMTPPSYQPTWPARNSPLPSTSRKSQKNPLRNLIQFFD